MKNKGQKDVRTEIAARLKKAREKTGYSVEEFCKKYDFNVMLYQRHESAELAMVTSEIMRYCAALKISVYFLMLGEEREEWKNPTLNTKQAKKPLTTKKQKL